MEGMLFGIAMIILGLGGGILSKVTEMAETLKEINDNIYQKELEREK